MTGHPLLDPLAIISNQHASILSSAIRFDTLLSKSDYDSTQKDFVAVRDLFFRDVKKHFEIEEKIFFRAALQVFTDGSMIEPVLRLQKEHGSIDQMIETILELSRGRSEYHSDIRALVSRRFTGLLSILRAHAMEEVESFFSEVTRSDRCIEMVSSLLASGGA